MKLDKNSDPLHVNSKKIVAGFSFNIWIFHMFKNDLVLWKMSLIKKSCSPAMWLLHNTDICHQLAVVV